MSSDYFTVISCLSSTLSYFILLFAYISVFYLIVTPERGAVVCFWVFSLFVFASMAVPSRPILWCCSRSRFCCYIMNCAQYGFKFPYLCLVDLDLLEVEI